MTDAELSAAVRACSRRQPFLPYLLEFLSGKQVVVDNREGIAPFADFWFYRSGPKQSLFSSSSVCRLLDIVEGE